MIIAIIVLLLYYAFIEYKYINPSRGRLNGNPSFENFYDKKKQSYARFPPRDISNTNISNVTGDSTPGYNMVPVD